MWSGGSAHNLLDEEEEVTNTSFKVKSEKLKNSLIMLNILPLLNLINFLMKHSMKN